ncbi:ATP-binding protein [Nocardioides ultimimeridianus]
MTSSSSSARLHLPAELTSFVGRRGDVAAIRRLASTSRMVTLTGFGGLGKTRLALHAAHEMRRAFRDGVCLVELAPLSSPDLLPHTVIDALRMRRHNQDPLDELCEELSRRNILIVLDNCEHLIDAAADLAAAVLVAAPEVTILATSRQPLRIPGEYLYPVAPLPLPEDDAELGPGTALQYPSVALLAERTAASVPGFTVTRENEASLIRLCRQLDGIPLAIELAASRLQVLDIDELVERLRDRSVTLRERNRSFPERHRTLEALIDWSHDLCSPGERLLWARAATFAGDFSLRALEDICADEQLPVAEVVDTVAGLVDRSIFLREEQGGHVRFRMLDTIRAYGRDRLDEAGETEELARRHRDWYARMIEQAGAEWAGPRQGEWARILRVEHPNVRVALAFSISTPADAEITLRMVAVTWFWMAMENHHEGRLWLGRALAAAPVPSLARAWALGTDAYLAAYQGDAQGAALRTLELERVAEALDDDSARAFAAHMHAVQASIGPEPARSVPLYRKARELYPPTVEVQHIDGLLVEMGAALALMGATDEARGIYDDLYLRCSDNGDRWQFSYALWGRALLHLLDGRVAEAESELRQSLRIKRDFQETFGFALVCELLSWAAALEGEDPRAAELFGIANTFWGAVGFRQLAVQREQYESAVRGRLGTESFARAAARGAALSRSDAIGFALREKAEPAHADEAPTSILTRRQREVAELVAEGLPNKEIATRLVISLRTVEGHVESILTKLGFSRRTQIASWVHRQSQDR